MRRKSLYRLGLKFSIFRWRKDLSVWLASGKQNSFERGKPAHRNSEFHSKTGVMEANPPDGKRVRLAGVFQVQSGATPPDGKRVKNPEKISVGLGTAPPVGKKERVRFFPVPAKIGLFIGIFCVGACVWDWGSLGNPDPASIIQESNLDDSVDEKLEGDDRRGRRPSGSYNRRGGKCRNDDRCADLCEDLFDDAGVVENCLDLSRTVVEGRGTKRNRGFEYILDVFDSRITYPALTNVDGESFKALMELSVEHWVNLTDDVTETEARALLAWIAADRTVTEVIREHGSDGNYAGFNSYEGFIRLMKEVGNRTGCDEYKDALTNQYLTGRFTFCCIALREGNGDAALFRVNGANRTHTSTENDIVGDINSLEDCTGNDAFVCPNNGGTNCPRKSG